LIIMAMLFQTPPLTRNRIRLAYGVAVTVDALQLVLGPLGWVMADQILDVAAMVAMTQLLGFHPLLLPAFVLEFLPIVDLVPTWTGCVAVVVALRRRQQGDVPEPSGHGSVIDV
jgi:hypothetical protein